MIDTHAHIYSSKFDEDREEVVDRAEKKGVKYLLLPNIDLDSIGPMIDLCESHKNCIPMMGLHPCSIDAGYSNTLEKIRIELFNSKEQYIAVGEIGIDLYWDKTYVQEQMDSFRKQIQWAKELKLPIVIHARDSFPEIFQVLDQENDCDLSGVFHCFSGTENDAQHILSYGGFKMGIGGTITYKKSKLPDVIKNIDLEHILLETDSPYLAPRPFRGKRNESSYLTYVVTKLSEIYECSENEIIEKTTLNAEELFNIQKFTS
ncbi:TatD family hydrolase [Crocinitomicaceae bacterium]|mgnify:FL=1|nr:TatD family hydrolase [Crocinitomicaceae bacterium]